MRSVDYTPISGYHVVKEALSSGRTISKLWLQQPMKGTHRALAALAKKYGVPYSVVPLAKLNRLTAKSHQGVVAHLSPIAFSELDCVLQNSYASGRSPLIVLLDRVTDVRNLGAVARTALCAQADALVLTGKGTAPISADALRASAGALAHLPVCRFKSLQEAMEQLKTSGVRVVACHERASHTIYDSDFVVPTAFVFGAEDSGIAVKHLRAADVEVGIPMRGPLQALNVSVSAAVVLYEAFRQRLG